MSQGLEEWAQKLLFQNPIQQIMSLLNWSNDQTNLKSKNTTYLKKEEKQWKQKEFRTVSSTPVKEIYTPSDLEEIGFDYSRDLGSPGTHLFVRGIVKDIYRGNLWIMGQYGGHATAGDSNKRYKYLIEQGGTGFFHCLRFTYPNWVRFRPSFYPRGEVGKVGGSHQFSK